MKKLLTTIFLAVSVTTGATASANMGDAKTFFNDNSNGFKGQARLTCQAKGDEVADTISAIVTAASSESTMSLFTNSLKFAHIGSPFIKECGGYMKDDEKEILTALVNFANSLVGEDTDI